MKVKTTPLNFETLLQAARDVCEANAAFALARASGKLDGPTAAAWSAQIYALEVRLEWLKRGRTQPPESRVRSHNVVRFPCSNFGRRTAR